MWFKRKSEKTSNLFKFLTYNLFLPLIIPFSILIIINIINEDTINIITGTTILQSLSLFLIVSFFTNIGFWSFDKKEVYEHPQKENYVAASLILGVFSVFLFISSTMELKINYFWSLMIVSILLLICALIFYYHNPLILHSNTTLEKEKGIETDISLEKKILASKEVSK